MKREIKFRAWSKGSDYRNGYWTNSGMYISGNYFGLANHENIILMQFTGLHDKNGKEIYEGDIVNSKSHSPENYTIQFIEGGFCATNNIIKHFPVDINHFYPSIGTDLIVIGNIYENPELLNS